jgi:hypothetical protein
MMQDRTGIGPSPAAVILLIFATLVKAARASALLGHLQALVGSHRQEVSYLK